METQTTVDSNKVAQKLLSKLATETWNATINEARIESLEEQLNQAKEENLALKKELSKYNTTVNEG